MENTDKPVIIVSPSINPGLAKIIEKAQKGQRLSKKENRLLKAMSALATAVYNKHSQTPDK